MSVRVLYVINGLGVGGSERSLAGMLPGLMRAGIDPVLACFYRRPEGVEAGVLGQGIDVRFLAARGTVPRVAALRRMIRRERIELVHTTHFEADVAGRLAALGTAVPVVTSLVSTPYAPARFRDPRVNARKLRLVRLVDSLTGRLLVAHFHAVSAAVRAAATDALGVPAERITVVHRGRDPGHMGSASPLRKARARKDLGLQATDRVLVHVGRHEYAKSQSTLLEAVARLRKRFPDVVLLIAGREGAASPELQQLHAALDLDASVHYLGHRDDVPEVLAAADVFVFPSRYEGLPGALIEAMALGLPIVATRIPAVLEVVEEGGNALLVEPGDVAGLTAAVGRLLDDGELAARFGARSRAIFEARFTMQRSIDGMLGLYRATLTAAGRQVSLRGAG